MVIGAAAKHVRLIVFNACHSDEEAEKVLHHVDATIGMTNSITDEAAKAFAAQLYSSIGFGLDSETAFNQARAVSASTVSNLNEKAFKSAGERRCRPLTCVYPYVYVDGIHEAKLGQLLRERRGDGRHRRERRRIPQGCRLRRKLHGVGRVLHDFLSWLKSPDCAASRCSPATRPPA